jgi:hypothetical protein
VLHDKRDRSNDAKEDQDRDNASGAPPVRFDGLAIEPAVEQADQVADPGHGMADRA